MEKAWDMMIKVCSVEERLLDLKKLACDGSMLKGHTVNKEKATQNKGEILRTLKEMELRIQQAYALASE